MWMCVMNQKQNIRAHSMKLFASAMNMNYSLLSIRPRLSKTTSRHGTSINFAFQPHDALGLCISRNHFNVMGLTSARCLTFLLALTHIVLYDFKKQLKNLVSDPITAAAPAIFRCVRKNVKLLYWKRIVRDDSKLFILTHATSQSISQNDATISEPCWWVRDDGRT